MKKKIDFKLNIKPLTKKDVVRALKCMKASDDRFDDYNDKKIEKYVKSPNTLILMAEENNEFVGYVALAKKDDDSRIEKFVDLDKFAAVMWIGVSLKHRKKGIGSKLLKASETYPKKWNKKGLWLDCRKDKLPFYKKNSYKNVGYFIKKRRRQYVMLKRLR